MIINLNFYFRKRGFNVESFGSGNQIKLPGPSPDRPNCYEFGVATYEYIYNDLKQKDRQLLVFTHYFMDF